MNAAIPSVPANQSPVLEGSPKPIRVLHVVESLDNQAVESWLLRVLSAARETYPHVSWTFFCVVPKAGKLDQVARELGAEVLQSRFEVGDKINFLRSLREVMKQGAYDVLHCHHDVMSAAYLAASVGLPFQKRIVHVHNTSLSLPTPSRIKQELIRDPMKRMCLRMADQIVGISKDALTSLVGSGQDQKRDRIVHYAVDTQRFGAPSDKLSSLRDELGISKETKVLLFVGRMVEYKNPAFVIEIMERLIENKVDVTALFSGNGDQEETVRGMVHDKQLANRVHLLGFRDDVPRLMQAADILIWPSHEEPKEGLGLGIVEAQAAGLPILMSRSAPEEAVVVEQLVDVLPLTAGAEAWADRTAEILQREPMDRREALAMVESSSFSMPAGVANLMALYEDVV